MVVKKAKKVVTKKTTRRGRSLKSEKKTTKKEISKKKRVVKKEKPQSTESDFMWEELRYLPIEMFALPNQVVENHIERVGGVPDALYLRPKSPAALPAFVDLVSRLVAGKLPKYQVEETDLYIIVKRFTQNTLGQITASAHLAGRAVIMTGPGMR